MSFRLNAVMVALAATLAAPAMAQTTGPSSSQTPYLVSLTPSVSFTSILTTGDAVGGYRMGGTPDGLGAYDNGNGTFTVLMNHELGSSAGVIRAQGGKGAYVSQWVIDKSTLQVVSGSDLIQSVYANTGTGWTAATGTALSFNRFCSADLASASAYYNTSSGLGSNARIFLAGEESAGGRGVATIATGADTGKSYILPWTVGANGAWENLVASPNTGDKTLVMGTSDGGTNGLYVYVGNKSATGNEVERAGLVGGSTYRIAVNGNAAESTAANGGGLNLTVNGSGNYAGSFSLVAGNDTTNSASTAFLRPEDGAWDTQNANVFYFVTTNTTTSAGGKSRLWKMTFSDLAHPENGGSIEMLLNGTEGYEMLDNMTVGADGKLVLQEDVGNNARLGAVWIYDPVTKQLVKAAQHDPARFQTGGSDFRTLDEESSGVIEVTDILGRNDGKRYYLLDTQNHAAATGANAAELVEGGQLQLMAVAVPEGDGLALAMAGLGVMGFVARRRATK